MSVTASEAFAALRAKLEAAALSIPLRFPGENGAPLPSPPSALAYVEFNNQGSGRGVTAFGGGVGANLYRNRGLVEIFVFTPRNDGLASALDNAESLASVLRSFRSAQVSCFGADVIPIGTGSPISLPGMATGVAGDYQCAVAEIDFYFDQIG